MSLGNVLPSPRSYRIIIKISLKYLFFKTIKYTTKGRSTIVSCCYPGGMPPPPPTPLQFKACKYNIVNFTCKHNILERCKRKLITF